MTAMNLRAAALAVLVTVATLGGMSGIADTEHGMAAAAAGQSAVVATVVPVVQQVVVVGRRAKA